MRIVLIHWGNKAAGFLLLAADFAWACRVAIAGLLLGFLALTMPTQVHDLLRSVAAGSVPQKVSFWVGAFAWAVTIHSSARFALSADFGIRFNPHEPTIARHLRITKWLPRALGLACFVVIGWALYTAMVLPDKDLPGYWGMMTVNVVLAVAFFILVRFRRPLGLLMQEIVSARRDRRALVCIDWKDKDLPIHGSSRAYAVIPDPHSEMQSPQQTQSKRRRIMAVYDRLGPFFALILVFVAGLPLIAAMVDLVDFGRILGPSLILFLVLSSWIPLITVLAFAADWRRLPLVFAFILLFPATWLLFGDPHDVQTKTVNVEKHSLEEKGDFRPSLKEAVGLWDKASTAAERPLLIVATAGGGSRAAFWTATVLGALADSDPRFQQDLFAISGVSGGAYGAAVAAALLRQPQGVRCRDDEAKDPKISTSARRCAQLIAGEDVLSPAIAALAYREGLIPFVRPLAMLTGQVFQDRATTIEQAMQQAWTGRIGRDGPQEGLSFRSAFTKFGPTKTTWAPILLMNGASVETGRRIITSPVAFSGAWPPPKDGDRFQHLHFADAYDFHALISYVSEQPVVGEDRVGLCRGDETCRLDISLATSVTNSARFPYVLPPGTIRDSSGNRVGRVVDGGYIENFGALTALELIRSIKVGDLAGSSRKIIVLLISSDPDLEPPLGVSPPILRSPEPSLLDQLAGPPSAIYNARVARGTLAALALRDEVEPTGVKPPNPQDRRFFHLRMFPSEGSIPLGWMLSPDAQKVINAQLCEHQGAEDNREEMKGLLAALGLSQTEASGKVDMLCPG